MNEPDQFDHPRVSLAYITRPEKSEQILCVWNREHGCWGLPGGKLMPGETSEQGLRRELSEETALWVKTATLLHRARNVVYGAFYDISVFDVEPTEYPKKESYIVESASPVHWLTRDELTDRSSTNVFRFFYLRFFEVLDDWKAGCV